MSASNNRSSPSNRSNENHVFYLDGRLSASPDSCESHLYQNPSCSNQPTSQSQHNRSANSGSPTSDVGNRSLLESTGDWSPLVRNANSHTADATGYSYSPSQHRYANKDYSLPTRKPELYAFFENPLTKTVEKLSKLTDFVVADRRTGQPKHRSYGFSSFVSPFEEQAPNGSGHQFHLNTEEQHLIGIPPPSLPHIESTRQVQRKPPITQEQFDETLSKLNKRELLNEIFYSGIESFELKRKLWPIMLGLYDLNDDPEIAWQSYKNTYELYKTQWKSFTLEQENRFNAFRERKNILQRDVIRCDRKHPFYKNEENIEKIQELLMNYVMHDFDTGYIQGMTDLAAPILHVFDGDVIKSFWCFVQVLEFTKKNFSISKETIFYQLKMLFKLIQLTDPCFAQYLAENNSANCHFAFRWLICLFKREFVKENAEDYSKCLIVWEAIWSINALQKLNEAEQKKAEDSLEANMSNKSIGSHSATSGSTCENASCTNISGTAASITHSDDLGPATVSAHDLSADDFNAISLAQSPICTINPEEIEELRRLEANAANKTTDFHEFGQTSRRAYRFKTESDAEHDEQFETLAATAPNPRLDDVELFSLCICLSLIRRERDIIMSNKIEDCGILEHFNRLEMSDSFDSILLHATTIWRWLKEDGEEEKLYAEKIDINSDDIYHIADGFDTLADDLKPVFAGTQH